MKKIAKLMETIYTLITFLALGIGFIVAVLFIISLVISGESLAVFAGQLMMWAIRLASLAIISGIIFIYLNKNHSLTMSVETKVEETIN